MLYVFLEQQTDVSVVYATLHMGPDGLLSSSAWSEAASVSTPTNQQFTEPEPEGHNCYEVRCYTHTHLQYTYY